MGMRVREMVIALKTSLYVSQAAHRGWVISLSYLARIMKSSPLVGALSAALLAGAQEYGTSTGNSSWESAASKLLSEQLQRSITTEGSVVHIWRPSDMS